MLAKQKKLVVIGNGMVGARVVEEVLARGRDRFEIAMFGDEPYGNYNRILLSSVLAGSYGPQDIFINPMSWYAEHGVTLHSGVRATTIDRKRSVVTGANGVEEAYDDLVIATGSTPFLPPIAGLHDADGQLIAGVFAFRTLEDCREMVHFAKHAKRAAVIGGGLLGLEAARGLLERGLGVEVVHLMPHLMEMQLDPPASALLMGTLERMGVRVRLATRTSAIRASEGRVEGLTFADGSTLDCDMVVVSAGIRPNTALAARSGLTVGRGIVVGDDLVSPDDARILAVGECAEHRGQLYGLVAPLWDQARVAAERLTDTTSMARYQGSRVSTKLKVIGVDLAVMGEALPRDAADEVVSYSEPSRGVYKKLIVRAGRLAGAIVLGDGAAVPSLLRAFDQSTSLPENRGELLFPGTGVGAERAIGAADLPDDAQVCNCNGVAKRDVVAAVASGCRSLKTVCDATRAGTGCGSCKGLVRELLELTAGDLVAQDPAIHYYVAGVALTKPELIAAVRTRGLRSVSAVFATLAGGKEDPSSKAGLASLLKTIWGPEYEDERDARFINDRVHANIQRDGTFSVVPRIYGGVTSAAQLRRIADVADKYDVPMVKLTGGQRIDLLGVAKEQLPDIWRELDMPSGHAYAKAFRTCKTCVGTEFCRYGVGDSTTLGIQIERRFQGIEAPAKMKLATAGCPRNCSEATTKDVGAVAIEGGRWEIYIGGAAGARVRKGDVLCVVDTHADVLRYVGRFMQYYREHARYLERSYDFVERIGIDRLRQLLIDNADETTHLLDEAMDSAVAAYVDPWSEADAPRHPAQFTTVVAADDGGSAAMERTA
ncbi:MAG: nitrite reductase large subunit NirB [Gemmatimonadaceae bacterium]